MKLANETLMPALARCALMCAAALLAGCDIVPPAQTDPTRYFILSDSGLHADQTQGGLRIGLKPVRIDGYLQNRDMVVRTGPNEVEFRDYKRWAEPIDRAIGIALQSDLLASPGVSQVLTNPSSSDGERDFDVSVEVTRFEGAATASGRYVASLSATIEISVPGANPRVVARRQFTAPDASWDGSDFDQLAGLLSADVAALAREVLAQIPAKG